MGLKPLGRVAYFSNKNYKMTEKSTYKTVKDYAKSVGKTEKTIYNWIESEKIPKRNIKKVLNQTLIKV